jgi:hypothetical protein
MLNILLIDVFLHQRIYEAGNDRQKGRVYTFSSYSPLISLHKRVETNLDLRGGKYVVCVRWLLVNFTARHRCLGLQSELLDYGWHW